MKTHEWVAVPDNTEEFILDKIREDRYERHQLALIEMFITKQHRVLEGGSGLGIVTRELTERAQFVVSCEANPELYECAEQNAPFAEVLNGVLSFSPLKAHTGTAFGVRDLQGVALVPDSLIAYDHLNALVLDVEGAEADILFNINLEPLDLIIVETHPELAGRGKLAGAHARLLVEGFTVLASKEDGALRHIAYSKRS